MAQVVLALLDFDAPCDAARFVAALLQPPLWRNGDFATALWGAAAEPAASLLKRPRRNAAAA